MASFEDASGDLGGDGELLDLRWVPVDRTDGLRLVDVTQFMIGEVRRIVEAPPGTPRGGVFTYLGGGTRIEYD